MIFKLRLGQSAEFKCQFLHTCTHHTGIRLHRFSCPKAPVEFLDDIQGAYMAATKILYYKNCFMHVMKINIYSNIVVW